VRLLDKIALVTGASHGIGRAVALSLAREGAHVAISDYNGSETAAKELKKEIEAVGRKVLRFKVDVTKAKEVEEMVRTLIGTFGKIDILVNCAGIYPRTLVVDMDEETWDRTIDTNLKGVFLCCKEVVKFMMQQKEGKIVNIASYGAIVGRIRGAHYCASKAGVIGFTKSLALEVASCGINVNAIAPGATDTDLWRGGRTQEEIEEKLKITSLTERIGKPEDIVGTVLFLVTEDSKYITGQVIFMNTL
jgi:3-oxoacyl-[acyl-carrier protein] reductase